MAEKPESYSFGDSSVSGVLGDGLADNNRRSTSSSGVSSSSYSDKSGLSSAIKSTPEVRDYRKNADIKEQAIKSAFNIDARLARIGEEVLMKECEIPRYLARFALREVLYAIVQSID